MNFNQSDLDRTSVNNVESIIHPKTAGDASMDSRWLCSFESYIFNITEILSQICTGGLGTVTCQLYPHHIRIVMTVSSAACSSTLYTNKKGKHNDGRYDSSPMIGVQ